MSRSLMGLQLATLACAAATAAHGQTTRAHLPAISGVAFGSSYAAAQDQLGPDFKAGAAPRQPEIRTLIGHSDINGESFSTNFRFTSGGLLNTVFATTHTPGNDSDACYTHWQAVRASLVAQFGQPDTQSSDPANDLAEAKFAFADGSTIDASELGCLIGVIYETHRN